MDFACAQRSESGMAGVGVAVGVERGERKVWMVVSSRRAWTDL